MKHSVVENDLSTIRDLIRWAVSAFNEAGLSFEQGMPNALDEAVYLCLSALHLPPDFSSDYFDSCLTADEKRAVLENYRIRIEQQKPAAYITNEAWFAGLKFFVDENVLIPRSPIAELIQNQFSPWISSVDATRVLDLCTGSGCIAIACAYAFESIEVVGSDISTKALQIANRNNEAHNTEDSVIFIESNLYEEVPQQPYDIIVANPPYVSDLEMSALSDEMENEPELALRGGADGMDLVVPLLQGAREFLSDRGILVVEVGYSQPTLEKLLPDVPFYWLEFTNGGDGVFLLTAEQLEVYQHEFDAL